MPLAANLDGVDICADECADVEEAVVAYPQPKFASSSESFHVTDCAKRNSAEAAGREHADVGISWDAPYGEILLTLGLASCPKR